MNILVRVEYRLHNLVMRSLVTPFVGFARGIPNGDIERTSTIQSDLSVHCCVLERFKRFHELFIGQTSVQAIAVEW